MELSAEISRQGARWKSSECAKKLWKFPWQHNTFFFRVLSSNTQHSAVKMEDLFALSARLKIDQTSAGRKKGWILWNFLIRFQGDKRKRVFVKGSTATRKKRGQQAKGTHKEKVVESTKSEIFYLFASPSILPLSRKRRKAYTKSHFSFRKSQFPASYQQQAKQVDSFSLPNWGLESSVGICRSLSRWKASRGWNLFKKQRQISWSRYSRDTSKVLRILCVHTKREEKKARAREEEIDEKVPRWSFAVKCCGWFKKARF